MSNILTDKSASLPPANKVDLRAVPGGLEQYYLSSSEWNQAAQFVQDARSGLLHPQPQWSGSDNFDDSSTSNTLGPLTGTSRWVFVRVDGDDTTGDGTIGNPYATIQKALDQLPRMLGHTSYFIDITGMVHDDAVSGALVFPDCVGLGVAGGVHDMDNPRFDMGLLGNGFPQGAPTDEYTGYWMAAGQVNLIALPRKYETFSFCDWNWPIAGTPVGAPNWDRYPPAIIYGVAVEAGVLGSTSSLDPQLNVCEPGETGLHPGFDDTGMFVLKHNNTFFPILSTSASMLGAISYDLVGGEIGVQPSVSGAVEVYTLGAALSSTIIFNDMKYSLGFMGVEINSNSVLHPRISNSVVSFDLCNLVGQNQQFMWNNGRVVISRCRALYSKLAPCAGSQTRIFGSAISALDNSDNASLPASSVNIHSSYIYAGDMDDHGSAWARYSRFSSWGMADGDSIYCHLQACSLGSITTAADTTGYAPAQIFIEESAIVDDPLVASGSTTIYLNNCDANISFMWVGSNDPGFYPNAVGVLVNPEAPITRVSVNFTDIVQGNICADLSRSFVSGVGRYKDRYVQERDENSSVIPYMRFAEMGQVSVREPFNVPALAIDGIGFSGYVSTKDAYTVHSMLTGSLSLSTGSTGIGAIGECMDRLVVEDGAGSVISVLSGGAQVHTEVTRDTFGFPTIQAYSLITGAMDYALPFKVVSTSYYEPGLPDVQLSTVYGYSGRPVTTYRKAFTYDGDNILTSQEDRTNHPDDLGW